MKNITRFLIVEDQGGPLNAIEAALKKVAPAYFPEFSCDVARCFSDAEARISSGAYDFVFLDHRMPYNDMGDMEDRDFNKFIASLREIGYSLIADIRKANPKNVVVGTSSLEEYELRRFATPDYKLEKTWGEAEKDMIRIFEAEKEKRQRNDEDNHRG